MDALTLVAGSVFHAVVVLPIKGVTMIKSAFKALSITIIITLATPFQVPAQNAPPPAKVRVAKVTQKSHTENSGLVGVLYYDRVSNISTQVSGQVRQAEFRAGSQVTKGATLVRINTDFYDQDIAVEKARIGAINVKIENVAKDLARFKSLLAKQAVSESAHDALYFNHQILIKERETVRAGLARIRLKRSKCVIRAPFDGIILEKSVDTSDWVTPGRTLYRIGAIDDLFVKVAVSEQMAPYSLSGTTVDVVLTAADKKVTGRIEGFLPVADPKTKNVTIKIRLMETADIGRNVAENMSAMVYLPTSTQKALKLIPRDALINRQGNNFVFTVKEGKAAMLPVTVVAYLNKSVGVNDPHITVDMPVVVEGNERLQPDQPVIVGEEGK